MRILIYLFALGGWVLASLFYNLNDMFLPDVQSGILLFQDLEFLKSLLTNLYITFSRVGMGVGIAIIVGLPLGLYLSKNDVARSVVEPLLDFMRGVPISMLFPLFIVFVGFGELSRSLIVVTLALPILATSVLIAAKPTIDNQERLSYFKLRNDLLSTNTRIRMDIWEALPGIMIGLRLSISLGLVVVIVTEMFFTAKAGIGWLAFRAYEQFAIDQMYLLILVAGLASIGLNIALRYLESSVK